MHKIKADSLQVNSIESKEQLLIAIQTILRYAEDLVPENDYDLVPKWYVDGRTIPTFERDGTDIHADGYIELVSSGDDPGIPDGAVDAVASIDDKAQVGIYLDRNFDPIRVYGFMGDEPDEVVIKIKLI